MIAFVISRFGIFLQMSILEEKDFPFLKNIPIFAKDNKIDLYVYVYPECLIMLMFCYFFSFKGV